MPHDSAQSDAANRSARDHPSKPRDEQRQQYAARGRQPDVEGAREDARRDLPVHHPLPAGSLMPMRNPAPRPVGPQRRGVTLIELIIVLTVLAVVGGLLTNVLIKQQRFN